MGFLFSEIFEYSFDESICRESPSRAFEVETIFFYDDITIAKVRTKTRPETIHLLRIELVPEVRVELLSTFEEVEYIEEPVVLIDMYTCFILALR